MSSHSSSFRGHASTGNTFAPGLACAFTNPCRDALSVDTTIRARYLVFLALAPIIATLPTVGPCRGRRPEQLGEQRVNSIRWHDRFRRGSFGSEGIPPAIEKSATGTLPHPMGGEIPESEHVTDRLLSRIKGSVAKKGAITRCALTDLLLSPQNLAFDSTTEPSLS